ncbi:unnamed protein product [Mytilus edulis]|uniref:Uncharacterized protein n=1 Tax=Mytilus edulis TaxID=6550 RepID=A0A8S3VBZ3_MYTED|nr:unnamed protein product [Mytilus edulis]
MSLARVSKQVRNLEQRLHQAPLLRTIPVILSDSKAKYLANTIDWSSHPDNKIFWWWKSGADTETQFTWLKDNLESKIQELSSQHFTIYIWLGTCDLTEKTGKFIKLRSSNNERVNYICETYKQIYKFLSDYPTIKVVFLELPYYSIYLWNLFQQHPEPEQFRVQDRLLECQIAEVNKFIRETNILLRVHSPDFGLDLLKVRKHHGRPPVYSNNYGLYIDGIHPHPYLARLWLIRILLRIVEDCQNKDLS